MKYFQNRLQDYSKSVPNHSHSLGTVFKIQVDLPTNVVEKLQVSFEILAQEVRHAVGLSLSYD